MNGTFTSLVCVGACSHTLPQVSPLSLCFCKVDGASFWVFILSSSGVLSLVGSSLQIRRIHSSYQLEFSCCLEYEWNVTFSFVWWNQIQFANEIVFWVLLVQCSSLVTAYVASLSLQRRSIIFYIHMLPIGFSTKQAESCACILYINYL